MKKAYLVLQDGRAFEGIRFGADGSTIGELVFTTGMCGYLETLTDPSYYGQIVMQTYPLIGNYGVMDEDFEGTCCVRGYVVREWCATPSNFRMQEDLDRYLKRQGIVALCGVDTRELTRIIREHGVMNAAICDEPPADRSAVERYAVTQAVVSVTRAQAQVYPAAGEERFRVALLDYGAKRNIIRSLQQLSRPIPRRRRSWPESRTASCSPTAPVTRRRTSLPLPRSKSCWARCRCSVSAWAIS